ncbi:MAG: cytochrome d ubiquinol oxidase subunit II [Terriglobales bacterium]
MEILWFAIVALMLTAYVVLDGFDLGVGIIYMVVARTDKERRIVLRSIGPVWDGNEVWLLAAGGTLYFAFPLLYASSFSGFYLPLMIVLWLLMLRAIGIELRSHVDGVVWRGFFDGIFSLASILLAIFYGAALGNVIRGVPLDKNGYFFEPLWTDWRVGPHPGILDWYTVLAGVTALVALMLHGALYLVTKTEGDVKLRAHKIATVAWPALLLLTVASLIGTMYAHPHVLENYRHLPTMLVPLVVFASLAGILRYHMRQPADTQPVKYAKTGFMFSCVYLACMLVGAAVGLFPMVLPSSGDEAYSLTIYNTAAGHYGLTIGLIWWAIGMVLVIGYFVYIYRTFRGKVTLEEGEGHGY